MSDSARANRRSLPRWCRIRPRHVGVAVLVIGLLIVFGGWLVTRSPLTRWVVIRAIEKSLPIEASCSSVRIGSDGIIRIRNLRLGDERDPSGVILEAPVCLIDVDWGTLLGDRIRVRQVALDGSRTRVSIERETGTLNLQSLFGVSTDEGGFDVPEIVLHEARVEFGEHDAQGFTLLEEVVLDGQLSELTGRPGFAVVLSERTGTMQMSGEVTPDLSWIEVLGVSLDRFGPDKMPSAIRDVMAALDLRGNIPAVRMEFAEDSGVLVRGELDGVEINLPFDREGLFLPESSSLARMTGVVGAISFSGGGLQADLHGVIEDLEYQARLESRDDPEGDVFTLSLETEGFVLEEHPKLIPYVPEAIERALTDFSRPTGVLDARVEVAGVIGSDGRFNTVELRSGLVKLRQLRASHVEFPYEFRDLTGEIRFDSDGAELIGIRGSSESGATVSASGTISPLNENATLRLSVALRGVAVDEHLKRALGEGRAQALEELFSEKRLAQLRDMGLADGFEHLELGAVADLDIKIVTGPETTSADATIRIAHAALLPERFPLPFFVDDLVIDASTELVEIRSGRFSSPAGGEASLSGRIALSRNEDGSIDIEPRLDIVARGVRSIPLVRYASSQAGMPHDRTREWTGRLLDTLGIDGRFDAEISVLRKDDGSIGYTADIRGRGITITPTGHPDAGELQITGAVGHMISDDDHIDIDVTGLVGGSPVQTKTLIRFDGKGPRVDSTTTVVSHDLRQPIEQLVGSFSRPAAERIARLRTDRDPSGVADAVIRVLLASPDKDPIVEIEISRARGLEFDDALGRVSIDDSMGSLVWDPAHSVRFNSFGALLAVDDAPQGRLTLDGEIRLGNDTPALDLAIKAEQIPLAGALAREAFRRALHDDGSSELVKSIAGMADASIEIGTPPGEPTSVSGTIRPASVSYLQGDRRIDVLDMTGEIEFDNSGLTARDISGEVAGWHIELDGSLERDDEGIEIDGALSAHGEILTEEMLDVFPDSVGRIARSIELADDGPTSIEFTQFHIAMNPAGDVQDLAIDGRISLDSASLQAGVGVQRANISGEYAIRRDQRDDLRITANLGAKSVLIENIRASDAIVRLRSNDEGSLWIPEFSLSSHGGRIAGNAVFEEIGTDSPIEYSLSLRMGEVALAPLLADLKGQSNPGEGEIEQSRGSRGVVSGEVSLTGVLGDIASRRGRGGARVFGGHVVDMPTLLQLASIANMQLPSSDALDLAVASFYIDGPTVVFEDLSAFAGPMEIFGFGSMTLPERTLDLRFVPRAARPVPVVGPLLEGINRELMTARIRGTPDDIQISAEPLRGTLSFLSRITGIQSDADEILERVERQAERSRSRLLRMTDRARALSSEDAKQIGGIEP